MTESKKYRCVNCGTPAAALYKTYGPSVLKLAKCDKCKDFVDKYIEYDPVIVVIDIVLMLKEAQRHVLYNTEFKSYWKLFIILTMLETYGLWRNESLFNVVINSMCGFQTNYTINSEKLFGRSVQIEVPETWKANCWAWGQDDRGDESDLFIWEKDFYILFLSSFSGIVMFILVLNNIMRALKSFTQISEVGLPRLVRGWCVGSAGAVFALPALVWARGAERAAHHALAAAYHLAVLEAVVTVMYDCHWMTSLPTVLLACAAKSLTTYHVTPYLRWLIT